MVDADIIIAFMSGFLLGNWRIPITCLIVNFYDGVKERGNKDSSKESIKNIK